MKNSKKNTNTHTKHFLNGAFEYLKISGRPSRGCHTLIIQRCIIMYYGAYLQKYLMAFN